MKNSILFGILFILMLTTACGQWNSESVKGNGNMISKTRNVEDYEKLRLVGSMNVKVVSGDEGNLTVEAESNLQDYIITEVKNGVLRIASKEGYNLRPRKEILITVPVESVNEISVTGSGDIWTKDLLRSKEMNIQVTGSGDLKLELESQHLEGTITGSGDIKLVGKTKTFKCTVTGSGDFEASQLQAENVEATVSGSGDIILTATNSLKASVSGSGDIVYKGNPEKQDFKTNGSGSISSY